MALPASLSLRVRLVALTTGAAMALAACSIKTMAVNTVGDALSAPGPSVYATDDDPELIRAALPFSLKTLESLLQASPNHKGMLLTACSGFTSYANAFVQLDAEAIESTDYEESERLKARARKLYLRGRDYCMRRVELKRPGLRQALATDPATALGDVKYDVEELYWLGASWGSAIAVGVDQPDLVADFPVVRTLMDKALTIDEDYADGAIHEVMHHPRRHVAEHGRRRRAGPQALRAGGRAVEGQVGLGLRGHGRQRVAAGAEPPGVRRDDREGAGGEPRRGARHPPGDAHRPEARAASCSRASTSCSPRPARSSPSAPRLAVAPPVPHAPVPLVFR